MLLVAPNAAARCCSWCFTVWRHFLVETLWSSQVNNNGRCSLMIIPLSSCRDQAPTPELCQGCPASAGGITSQLGLEPPSGTMPCQQFQVSLLCQKSQLLLERPLILPFCFHFDFQHPIPCISPALAKGSIQLQGFSSSDTFHH